MEFDFETIGYIVLGVVIVVIGFFIGLWLLGIAIVGGLVFGAYMYIKKLEDDTNNPEIAPTQEQIELKLKIENSLKNLEEKLRPKE